MRSAPDGSFYQCFSELRVVLQILPTSSRADSSLNSSTNDESDLVRRLRDQITRLNKDIVTLHAMAALVKRKKNEIATAIEQHALDRLHIATESLSCKCPSIFRFLLKLEHPLTDFCFSTVVASDSREENTRIHEKIEAMTNVAHPKHELWSHQPKAVVVAKFEHRAEKVHYYFEKYHAHLSMV
jgi:hypothetical protein